MADSAPWPLASPAADPARPIASVLFVCTGNVCRSPFAERLLAALAPHVRVTSRGTHALVGSAMDADMAAELQARGGDAAGFVSRSLAPVDLEADLVLAMETAHLDVIRDEQPAALLRSGLLGHADSLAGLAQDGPLTVRDVRSWSRTSRTADGAIADPYRRGRRVAGRSATAIEEMVRPLAAALSRPEDVA